MTKINISIPQPCHENWEAMTNADKGRFCDSCQKKVFDFTASSDREIVTAFQQNKNLCGRFLNTQLDRDLIKPERKSSIWLVTSTALISLVGLNEVTAQEQPVKTEQTDNRALGKFMVTQPKEFEISGVVLDDQKLPLPGANIIVKEKSISTQTDFDGKFIITAKVDDIITVSFVGFEDFEFKVNQTSKYNIILKENHSSENVIITVLGGVGAKPLKVKVIKEEPKKRTFFGRLFHKK